MRIVYGVLVCVYYITEFRKRNAGLRDNDYFNRGLIGLATISNRLGRTVRLASDSRRRNAREKASNNIPSERLYQGLAQASVLTHARLPLYSVRSARSLRQASRDGCIGWIQVCREAAAMSDRNDR